MISCLSYAGWNECQVRYQHTASCALAVAVVVGLAGCEWAEEPRAAAESIAPVSLDDQVKVPDAPPDELAELLKTEIQNINDKKQNKRNTGSPRQLRILTAVAIANRIATDPESDESQKTSAKRSQLALLYQSLSEDREMFAPRLAKFAATMRDQDPHGELTALASACETETEFITSDKPVDDVLAALSEQAKAFPGHLCSVELYRLYGKRLENQKKPAEAAACYRAGIKAFGGRSESGPLQGCLDALKRRQHRQTVTRHKKEVARQLKLDELKQKLGGHSDGYFVIYARQNVTPSRTSMISWYRYEYEVLHSLESAIKYTRNLPERWSWELIRRFPKTKTGRADAYQLWKEIKQKKRGKKAK